AGTAGATAVDVCQAEAANDFLSSSATAGTAGATAVDVCQAEAANDFLSSSANVSSNCTGE
ncbi:hypothetical protein, partial [Mycolicibacter minnesotensis]|uniref:hypothetical protein n=1 Tax=Mycolicibacter minnesotensis TaxID=1118379 RepID=UPI0021F328D0